MNDKSPAQIRSNLHLVKDLQTVNQYRFPREECAICLDCIKDEEPLSCGHWIHRSCVLKWRDECPICRDKIELSNLERQSLKTPVESGSLAILNDERNEIHFETIVSASELHLTLLFHIIDNFSNIIEGHENQIEDLLLY